MMQIKELAERSGFPAATLRYYEQVGLLPEPARTAAGYRRYEASTLERLAFIARAKELGCRLDEIADLLTAWDGGRCGPVQDRLRTLVTAKIEATRRQMSDLTALAADLSRAAAQLERHRPDGPCDDRCACTGDPDGAAGVAADDPIETVAVACALPVDGVRRRIADWEQVLRHATGRQPLADGVRLELSPVTPLDDLARAVADERRCCPFLRFAITVDERGVALEVHGPPDARAVIDAVFGHPTATV